LYAGGGEDILVGGPGNDTIYYYNPLRQVGDGLSVLRFGPGIGPDDVTQSTSGNNVVYTVTAGWTSGKITFNSGKTGLSCQVDKVQFSD
jgi:hypothetical protein